MAELILPQHTAAGHALHEQPRVVLACGHKDDIRTCAVCGGEDGKQYELDQAIKEAAGGVSAIEWGRRGWAFKKKAAELSQTLGRDHAESKQARAAARQCFDLSRELQHVEERERVRGARGSTETRDLGGKMVRVPLRVDLQREADNHELLADEAKKAKGLNHPDTRRHLKAAKRLRRLAKKEG